jgi:hypothetical protein
MKLKMHRLFSTFSRPLIGLLLSSCATGTGGYYSPQVRDVSEEVIDGNYWYQKFTLYDPANSATDCPISRTGQKLDLNSPAELAKIWRDTCSSTKNEDSGSSGM